MHDIHCHVLYGVDDGAKDFKESIEICKSAAADGVNTIVATPHYIDGESEVDCSKIFSLVYLLNQELKNSGVNLVVLPGMEIFLTSNIAELYKLGKIIALNCKKYMLIELPLYNSLPTCLSDVIFKLQLNGIKPVIAHPERCKAVVEHPNIIYSLIEKECIIQVNSGSLRGMYGKDAENTANKLLEHNMVHIIASDTHSSSSQLTSMKGCYGIVSKKLGVSIADDLFINNQFRIINGEKISVYSPLRIKKKKFWII